MLYSELLQLLEAAKVVESVAAELHVAGHDPQEPIPADHEGRIIAAFDAVDREDTKPTGSGGADATGGAPTGAPASGTTQSPQCADEVVAEQPQGSADAPDPAATA